MARLFVLGYEPPPLADGPVEASNYRTWHLVQPLLDDGHTGLLVNRDPDEFAAAVERLLTDSALAERLGQQGRADVCERWTWERAVRRIERYLEMAIRGDSAAHSD